MLPLTSVRPLRVTRITCPRALTWYCVMRSSAVPAASIFFSRLPLASYSYLVLTPNASVCSVMPMWLLEYAVLSTPPRHLAYPVVRVLLHAPACGGLGAGDFADELFVHVVVAEFVVGACAVGGD